MASGNCYSCVYRINITEAEKQLLIPKLRKADLDFRIAFACIGSWSTIPHIVQRYLNSPIQNCQYFAPGYFSEPLPVKCPTCKTGQLRVNRPVKDKVPYILFGCSSYPNCNTTPQSITLETNCRYCNEPLVLSGRNLMTVQCPKCKRSIPVPVLFRSWPYLLKKDQCPHGKSFDNCDLCKESIQKRISLLDLELPGISMLWNGKGLSRPIAETEIRPPETTPIDIHSDEYFYGSAAMRDAEREWEEEVNEERNEFISGYERSDDSGWFYPD